MCMRKNVFKCLFAIAALVCVISTDALSAVNSVPQKAKKPKKPAPTWTELRPEKLSNVEEIDDYILYCDTIWDRIQTYKEEITFFKLDTVWALDGNDTVKVIKITDEAGVPRNFSHTLKQTLETTLTGTNLLLDVTLVSLKTTNAGLALASNPLLVFGYTKCLKGGPQIVKLGYAEVKEIIGGFQAQSADIKKIKASQLEGSTDQAVILAREEGEMPDLENLQELANIDLGSSDDELAWEELDNIELPDIPDEPVIEKGGKK